MLAVFYFCSTVWQQKQVHEDASFNSLTQFFFFFFCTGSETLTGSTRVFFSNLALPFVFVFAIMLLPATAYLVREWRYLSLFMAVPGLACIPLWWWDGLSTLKIYLRIVSSYHSGIYANYFRTHSVRQKNQNNSRVKKLCCMSTLSTVYLKIK